MQKSFLSVLFAILLLNSPVFAAVDFDRVDDFLCQDNPSQTNMPTQHPLTITAWIYPNDVGSSGSQAILIYGESHNTGFRISLTSLTNDLRYTTLFVKDYSFTTITIVNNEWQFIAVSVDSGDDAIAYHYLPSSNTWTSETVTHTADMNAPTSAADLTIGASSSGTTCAGDAFRYGGQISDISIHQTNLTQSQIEMIGYARVKRMSLQLGSLGVYFPLDEEDDGSSADGDTFNDLSGNGKVLTGNDGANNTGLTAKAEAVLSYP